MTPPSPIVEPAPGDNEFYQGFESLGSNCEFGLVQRHFGAEPLGLLRWPAIDVAGLLDSLKHAFAELSDTANFSLIPGPNGDWDVQTPNFSLHLYTKMGSVEEDSLLKSAFRRITFMRRSLLETLEEAEKIMVFKEWQFRMSDADISAMGAAVKRYNPANRFLAVRLSTPDNPPGTVSEVEPGLWSGYVEWDARVSAIDNVPLNSWDRICRFVRAEAT
jgi:hypothetical protein